MGLPNSEMEELIRTEYEQGFVTDIETEKIAKGLMISDLVAIIGSLDVVAPEIDR